MTVGVICASSLVVCALFILGIAWLIMWPQSSTKAAAKGVDVDSATPGSPKSFKARAQA